MSEARKAAQDNAGVGFPLIFEVRRIAEGFYELDYPYCYHLDDLLEQGVGSTTELGRFVQRSCGLDQTPRLDESEGFACTTFHAQSPEGHWLLGRNFDYKVSPCLLVRTTPAHGYASVSMTDLNVMLYGKGFETRRNEKRLFMAPYACMDGINEKGLAIAVLELKAKATRQHTGRAPLTTTVFIRAALDTCATVDDVVALFSRYDMRAALFCDYHYQVADASGATAVLEYVDGQLHVVRNQPYAMNFYLLPGGDNRKAMGYDRRDLVAAALGLSGEGTSPANSSGEDAVLLPGQCFDLLEQCRLRYRHKRGYMIDTLWRAVYDCTDASVEVRTWTGAAKRSARDIRSIQDKRRDITGS